MTRWSLIGVVEGLRGLKPDLGLVQKKKMFFLELLIAFLGFWKFE